MRFNYFSCMNSTTKDIMSRFDEKLEELMDSLSHQRNMMGSNCAIQTFTNILEVLDREDFKSIYYTNLISPFPVFGGYKGKSGWESPCGTVCGALAAIGVIMGGNEKVSKDPDIMRIQGKAGKFAKRFEEKFGAVSCAAVSGYDLSTMDEMMKYVKSKTWEKKCIHALLFAIDEVRNLTKKELKKFWQ